MSKNIDMKYQNKYLKYKNKYLNLKNQAGGFIKGFIKAEFNKFDINKEDNYTNLKQYLDTLMPLCDYDSTKTNFILINENNYILINKKKDEEYSLFQLNKNFDILSIDKNPEMIPEMIKDNIVIPGINKETHGIYLIQAYKYYNDDIFRNFLSKVWISGYEFFNRLKNIFYKNLTGGQIVYQNQINIVLSLIFMNKLDVLLSEINTNHQVINDFYKEEEEKTKVKTKVKINKSNINKFNDIKTDFLYDYINVYDIHMLNDLKQITNFTDLCTHLYVTLSNMGFKFINQKDDFNLLMTIVKKIYGYINDNEHLVNQYNYSLYIHKYKSFNLNNKERPHPTSYKSLLSFINEHDFNYIKNKLILNLSSLIYLCYKTNMELGNCYMTAQYMILDYFYGICRIKNSCVPINQRQVLITILGLTDNQELISSQITDNLEGKFYRLFTSHFKEIKQYNFPGKYTDCGETTILNVFNYFLIKEDGTFNLENSDSWDVKLKEFYDKYNTMQSMTNIPIDDLKTDLANVLNNRGSAINYNRQGDINTTVESMIKTCAFLLNIRATNFKEIFKKLKPQIDDNDVIRDGNKITYLDVFTLELKNGHGEFKLNIKLIDILNETCNLKAHWINLNNNNLPENYSLDHFKYYIKYGYASFFANFPKEKQTDEFRIEAVKQPENPYYGYDDYYGHNIMHIYPNLVDELKNPERRQVAILIYLLAFTYGELNTEFIPDEILTDDFYYEALKKNILVIKQINEKSQNKEIIKIIKENLDKIVEYDILSYINKELIDYSLCITALKTDPHFFKSIPKNFQSYEMVELIIEHVRILKTNNTDYENISSMINLFDYMRKELFNEKICNIAFAVDPRFFRFIPADKQTKEMIQHIELIINQKTEEMIKNTQVQEKINEYNNLLISKKITAADFISTIENLLNNNKEYFDSYKMQKKLIEIRNSINTLNKFGKYKENPKFIRSIY